VSHAPERKEKDCLNCGAILLGRYCHICGQENVVPKESFGKLVIHFFYDITHFDGKFFYSLKYLVFRPGFLSKEYIKGRRASYLNPVRMYVFTSAIFFLIFFILVNPKDVIGVNNDMPLTDNQRIAKIKDFEAEFKKEGADTTVLLKMLALLRDTTKQVKNSDLINIGSPRIFLKKDSINYRSIAEYDSVQKTLSSSERDGWFSRLMIKKQIHLSDKYTGNVKEALIEWVQIFLHKLPYLLFLSLPIFAAILKLLYVRRRQFFYADHAIFSIHHYIFSFILLLVIFLLGEIKAYPGLHWLKAVEICLFIGWPVYLYIAMLNFYKQGWFKTFIKFFLLNSFGFILLLLLFVLFFFLSIFQL